MTFISYARNLEDVLLHRALAEVDRGFYVDASADAPRDGSPTKAFYDLGWSGLLVAPDEECAERLRIERPRDLVTTASASPALSASLADRGISLVHFLRLGSEPSAVEDLDGLDLERLRPWILLLPSSGTGSDQPSRAEGILVAARYRPVWFDGVHRFFVAEEHETVRARFGVAPNVFDDFKTARVAELEAKVDRALAEWEATKGSLEADAAALEAELERAKRWTAAEAEQRDELVAQLDGERRARFPWAGLRTAAEARLQREHQLFDALVLLMGELERAAWARALSHVGPTVDARRLLPETGAGLRTRLRKARRYLMKHPGTFGAAPDLVVWLDAVSKLLPESVEETRVVPSLDSALGRAHEDAAGALPRGTWLPASLAAQVRLRRRVRKVRRFLAKRTPVVSYVPGVLEALDEVSGLLPSEVDRAPSRSAAAELARIRRELGLVSHRTVAPEAETASTGPTGASVLVLSTYPCVRPRHGGQVRLANVLEAYRRGGFHVRSIAVYEPESFADADVGPLDVPFPMDCAFRLYGGRPVPLITDLLSGQYAAAESGAYPRIRASLVGRVDVIHLEQPWLLPLAKRLVTEHDGCRDAVLVYGSQNIEIDLKQAIFRSYDVRTGDDALIEISDLERDAASCADLTLAVTENDRLRLEAMGARHAVLAANGISPWQASPEALDRWRARLPSSPWLLYVASAHPPNFQGFIPCVGDSLACIPPSSSLVVAGSVGPHVERVLSEGRFGELNRSRIRVLGVLDDDDLAAVKTLAHGFVLPLLDGGGSNIKTAEALYSGKHVIATSVSLRGYDAYRDSTRIHVADAPTEFQAAVRHVLSQPPPVLSEREEKQRLDLTWERCLEAVPSEVTRARAQREDAR